MMEACRLCYGPRVVVSGRVFAALIDNLWPDVGPPWPLVALAAWLGTIGGTYSFDRELSPWMTSRMWFHETFAA
jgi:hypothetical protein